MFTNEIYKEWSGMTAKEYKPQGLEENRLSYEYSEQKEIENLEKGV